MMVNCKGILLERENEVPNRKRMGYLKDYQLQKWIKSKKVPKPVAGLVRICSFKRLAE